MSGVGILSQPIGDDGCDAIAWRRGDALHLSVVVKGTFSLVADGPMVRVASEAVLIDGRHQQDSPTKSLRQARERVPFRPRVDITAVGHAVPPRPAPAMSVRLAIYRGQDPQLDKTLHVFGPRTLDAAGKPGAPQPVDRVPLTYELAARGDANPTGVRPDKKPPQIIDPHAPDAPAGFGPISPYAKSRRALLGNVPRAELEAEIPTVPVDFDGAYFQGAPPDQQIVQLYGDEWVVLDGFSAEEPRTSSQLPRARAEACVVATTPEAASALGTPGPLHFHRVRLAADSLHVDADAGRVVVLWRGSVEVTGAELDALRVVGGVACGDEPMVWPDPRELAGLVAELPDAPAEQVDFDGTQSVQLTRDRGATPFDAGDGFDGTVSVQLGGKPRSGPTPFEDLGPSSISAPSPWGVVAIKPIPQQIGAGLVTFADASGMTTTLSPEERAAAKGAGTSEAPFPVAGPDEEGTQGLSPEQVQEAMRRATDTPFRVAGPGESRPAEAPEGAPWADSAGSSVPQPIGAETLDLGGTPVAASRFFHHIPVERRSEAPQAPPIPKRTTDSIPIVALDGLQLAATPWRHRPPDDSLTVIAKASYNLAPDGAVTRAEEAALLTGDVHVDDDPDRELAYASDFALFKPRADVWLTGHAYPPAGHPTATQVRLRVGAPKQPIVDRLVAVFGDRTFGRMGAPSEPAPFEAIPLTWSRAFGGKAYAKNPVGLGYAGKAGTDGVARLPNLEDPAHLVQGPDDRPEPACLGPVAPRWPARWRNMGSYSTTWLEEQWPYFPDDFDWAHFQAAPRVQQVETLQGDEPFLLTGLHAEATHIQGSLPGERPRCFMATTGEGVGAPGAELAFEEVKLALDTLAFDLDAMRIDLVWRGILEVSGDLAPEIETLFVMMDPAGTETTNDEAFARLCAAVAPKEVLDVGAPDNDVAMDEATAEEPEAEEPPEEPAEVVAARERVAKLQAEHRARLEAEGIDPDAPPDIPPPDPEAIAATLRKSGADEETVAKILEAVEAGHEEPPEDAPPVDPRAELERLLAEGASLDGIDLRGVDLQGLDLSGQSLREADLGEVAAAGVGFAQANLAGARLAGADLSGADLRSAQLAGADLVGATLTGAVLDGAGLEGADLSDVEGGEVSMRGAAGERVAFDRSRWPGASFEGARLPQASFAEADVSGASFDGADLTRGRLFDADATRATFRGTILVDALLDSLHAPGATLFRVRAESSIWERAHLADATLLECALDGASFLGADLSRADLSASSLREAGFVRADLTAAKLVRSDLHHADLGGAILQDADFTRANLYGAETWKADLRGTRLDEAIVAMSKLEGR